MGIRCGQRRTALSQGSDLAGGSALRCDDRGCAQPRSSSKVSRTRRRATTTEARRAGVERWAVMAGGDMLEPVADDASRPTISGHSDATSPSVGPRGPPPSGRCPPARSSGRARQPQTTRWTVCSPAEPSWPLGPLSKLRSSDLDRLYRHLVVGGGVRGAPLAPATVRRIHGILRRALAQGVPWGWTGVESGAS